MILTMVIENNKCNLLPGDNSRGQHHHHHHHGENNHHHQHHGAHNQSIDHHPKEGVSLRKGKSDKGSIDFSRAVLDNETGLKCVMKAENLTGVKEPTPLLTCKHSTISVCYDSYVTMFRAGAREEECDVYYKKKCRILFNKVARTETVRQCNKVSECHDETVTRVTDLPEESCDLVPTKVCRGVYRTTPYLEPTTQCEDLPKEICNFGFQSKVRGTKHLTIKWCYDPHNEDIVKESLNIQDPHIKSPLQNQQLPQDLIPDTRHAKKSGGNTNIKEKNTKFQMDDGDHLFFPDNLKQNISTQLMVPHANTVEHKNTRRNAKNLKKGIKPRDVKSTRKEQISILDILDTVKKDPERPSNFFRNEVNLQSIENKGHNKLAANLLNKKVESNRGKQLKSKSLNDDLHFQNMENNQNDKKVNSNVLSNH